MKYLRIIMVYMAASLLAVFVGFDLAFAPFLILRLLSAAGGIGILFVMLGDHARKIVLDELKEEQMSTSTMIVMCISASLTSIISWFTLFIAKIEGSMDFYPFYKLINGSVLVLINFVESSAKTFDLSMGELMMLFPLSFIPAIAVIIGYYKAKKEHSYLKTAKK